MHIAVVRRLCLLALLVASTVVIERANAQSTEGSDSQALTTQRLNTLQGQALGLDQNSKEQMLDEVEELLANGSLPPDDPRIYEMVAHVATESWARPVTRGMGTVNDFPSTRAHAARVLGTIGTQDAYTTLFAILRREQDTTVLGEAAMAIAAIPTEDRQRTIDILAQRLQQMANTARPDHAFTYALIQAVRTLHETSGAITDPDLYSALIAVSQGSYSGPIRDLAVDTVLLVRRSNTAGH